MEINSTRADGALSPGAVLAGADHFPPISQLPNELLVAVLHFALPRVDFSSGSLESLPYIYMQRLHILRSVMKQWQVIIEGTPSFWTIILSTLPPHVNEASIRRSADLPLGIIYQYSTDELSSQDFLDTIIHTRQRWSSVFLFKPTDISGYIGDPAPLIQTIIVVRQFPKRGGGGQLELLGGDTTNLRHVELRSASICWKVGGLVRLRYLDLTRVREGLTGSHLLDILRTSPGLQVLILGEISTDIPPPSPIITLHQLKYIDIDSCAIDLVQYILRHIRAPSCTKLCLCISEGQEFDVPHFINEIMDPFSGILFAIHKRYRGSEIRLGGSRGFNWRTYEGTYSDHGFSILIEERWDPLLVEWVDRILLNEPGLRINFGYGALSDEIVLGCVARMRCAVDVLIARNVRPDAVSPILTFLGHPLNTNASLPPFPYLRGLRITVWGSSLQDLLDMVQSRFCGLSWETMEPTPLTIHWDCGPGFSWCEGGIPPPIIEFATLAKIRKTDGVGCVKIVGSKDLKGMLAVKWDEEASRPVWV